MDTKSLTVPPASRDIAFVRSRGGIPDDHPFLRTVVELVASLRRFVCNFLSLPIHPFLLLLAKANTDVLMLDSIDLCGRTATQCTLLSLRRW